MTARQTTRPAASPNAATLLSYASTATAATARAQDRFPAARTTRGDEDHHDGLRRTTRTSHIPQFFETLADCGDIISGAATLRATGAGTGAARPPRDQPSGSPAMVNEVTGWELTDAFCGFKAYTSRCPFRRDQASMSPGYAMPLEFWARAWRARAHGSERCRWSASTTTTTGRSAQDLDDPDRTLRVLHAGVGARTRRERRGRREDPDRWLWDVICVGAHPDDVEIGMGACVAKLVRGRVLAFCLDLTERRADAGTARMRREMVEAAAFGVPRLSGARRLTLDLAGTANSSTSVKAAQAASPRS